MTNRNFAAELQAARAAEDWAAHERIWEERRHADVEHDEAMLAPQDIIVSEDMYAPYVRWTATVGDYDLDCTVGEGRTPLDAIVDLLDKLED